MKIVNHKKIILFLALLILPCVMVIALTCGRIDLSVNDVIQALFFNGNSFTTNIIYNLRLPRIIGAVVIGAALSVSGMAFQNLFQNPLVSPDLLGVSYGASAGAASAILLGLGNSLIQLFSFAGGIIAVVLTLLIPFFTRKRGTLILVLSGIIISGFMQSIIGLLKYLADPDSQLQNIVYWQLGSIAKVDFSNLVSVLPTLVIGLIIIFIFRWHLTVLSLGDLTSFTQGINVVRDRIFIIIGATLLTSGSICLSGTIGWIGLIIPHIARILIGEDSHYSLPLSAILGAEFLLLIDTLARTLSSGEIPLSILTGFIGAPIFVYILIKRRCI